MILGVHLTLNGTSISDTIVRAERLGLDAAAVCIASPLSLANRPEPDNFMPLNTTLDVSIHAPYVINPASASKKSIAEKILLNEVKAAERLGAKRIVMHPGSATDCLRDEAVSNIREVLAALPDAVDICVETMVGQGNEMCYTLEELARVVEGLPEHIGVCLDTCHLHDAGYDLTNTAEFLSKIESTVGFDRVKIIHVNGSLNERGSRKDRHAALQDKWNLIPVPAICALVQSMPIKNIPVILECFKNDDTVTADLALLKRKVRVPRVSN